MRTWLAIALVASGCQDRKPVVERADSEDVAHCDRLVPKELRTRYLADLPLSVAPRTSVGMVTCRFAPEGTNWEALAVGQARGVTVSSTCEPGVTSDVRLKAAAETYATGERVPDLGKLAIAWLPNEVRFWDRDCSVTVSWWLADRNALPFAREVHAAMLAASP